MSFIRLWVSILALGTFQIVEYAHGARILAILPLNAPSHNKVYEPILLELAKRGHYVDVVTHFPKSGIERYNCFDISSSLPNLVFNATDVAVGSLYCIEDALTPTGVEIVQSVIKEPIFKELLTKKGKYDLLITEVFTHDFMLAYAYKLQIPSVGLVSSVLVPWASDRLGNVDNPAYIPNYFLQSSPKMGIVERVANTFLYVYTRIMYELRSNLILDELVREFFDEPIPPLRQLAYNMSLLLTNSHFSINQPRPHVPNVVEIGGVQIKEAKPLTGEIAQIIDSVHNQGVIFFTLGTMVHVSTLAPDDFKALMLAFGSMPYTVFIKGNASQCTYPVPSNVYMREWLPQMDILCHPKTKLFITHGGLLGSQEAVYCGVPLVGIPLFADQYLNIKNYKLLGVAEMLEYANIKRDLFAKVTQILNNSNYKKRMEQLSKRFRDRPMSALDTAIYWIEYVIRHRGAPHLKSHRTNLYWFQANLIDVTLILLLPFVALGYLIRRYCSARHKSQKVRVKAD